MCDNKIMMMKTVKENDMTIKLTPRKKIFVTAAAEMFGNGSVLNKDQIRIAADKAGVPYPSWMSRTKIGYNKHKLPELDVPAFIANTVTAVEAPAVDTVMILVASNL